MRRTTPYGQIRTKIPVGYERLRCDTSGDRLLVDLNDVSRAMTSKYRAVHRNHKRRLFHLPCVYFLLQKDQVIYIGATRELKERVKEHFRAGRCFNEVRILPVPDSFRWIEGQKLPVHNHFKVEAQMINHYQPPMNIHHNPAVLNS